MYKSAPRSRQITTPGKRKYWKRQVRNLEFSTVADSYLHFPPLHIRTYVFRTCIFHPPVLSFSVLAFSVAPPLPLLLSPPFPLEVGPPTYSEGVWGSAGSSPADKRFGAYLESKSAALVAAFFVYFPKHKCNFLHKSKLDIVRRVQFLTGRRPLRSFSPGAVATIALWKSAPMY